MTLASFLTTITRTTRGRSPRPVTFQGLPVEIQKIGEDGNPVVDEKNEPVMVANNPENLPDSGTIYAGIVELLKSVENDIRITLAKTYNAVAFSIEVAATAAIPAEDFLTPVLIEYGITDEALATKVRRSLTAAYNAKVELGKYPADESADDAKAHKLALLKRMLTND